MESVIIAGVVGRGRQRLTWRQGVKKVELMMELLCEDMLHRPKWN